MAVDLTHALSMATHDLYEMMQTCRAVRRLRPDPIPDDVLRRVLDAARWAPSGGNRQGWRVIVVRDREKKEALGALYQRGWSAYAASNRKRLEALPEERSAPAERQLAAGDHLASHLGEAPAVLVFCFDPGSLAITDQNLERPSVVGGGSLYPAVQNLLLACRAEGLGGCLTTLLCAFEPKVKEILGIPEPWGIYAMVAIGRPVGRGHGPLNRQPFETVFFEDRFGEPLALDEA